MSRAAHIAQFYELMDSLRRRSGGPFTLGQCKGTLNWPARGVYFFFEPGEYRQDSECNLRVTRVGTHALKENAATTLWLRLSQHVGSKKSKRGNHRGSIFRLLVGEALMKRAGSTEPLSWGVGANIKAASIRLDRTREVLRAAERDLELSVSAYVGSLPFLFVAVNDDAGPSSDRGLIERNSIALLSNLGKPAIDPHSTNWLGAESNRIRVRNSGLWNNNHVDDRFDPSYFEKLEKAVNSTDSLR